jgi:hypothetical protein
MQEPSSKIEACLNHVIEVEEADSKMDVSCIVTQMEI